MNETEKNLIQNIYDEIEHIYKWDNKNLYKRQEQRLCYCLQVLENMLGGKYEQHF